MCYTLFSLFPIQIWKSNTFIKLRSFTDFFLTQDLWALCNKTLSFKNILIQFSVATNQRQIQYVNLLYCFLSLSVIIMLQTFMTTSAELLISNLQGFFIGWYFSPSG